VLQGGGAGWDEPGAGRVASTGGSAGAGGVGTIERRPSTTSSPLSLAPSRPTPMDLPFSLAPSRPMRAAPRLPRSRLRGPSNSPDAGSEVLPRPGSSAGKPKKPALRCTMSHPNPLPRPMGHQSNHYQKTTYVNYSNLLIIQVIDGTFGDILGHA
jgi:hypothetical protein